MCPRIDKHFSVVWSKASGCIHTEYWWCLLLERATGLKERIFSLHVLLGLHWICHTLVIKKKSPYVRYKTRKYNRGDNRVVGCVCGSQDEAVPNSGGGCGGGFCRMSRSALDGDEQRDYSRKKGPLGRSKYSCPQSKCWPRVWDRRGAQLMLDSQSSTSGYRGWLFVCFSWILLINIMLVTIFW